MDIPVKRLEDGFAMPVFGMGTWMLGGAVERDPDNDDERDIAALRAGIDHGLKHIDTAEMYAGGFAEQIVGQAIRGYDRNSLFITSKVSPCHFSYEGVLAAAEDSLSRLGTDYLDLYMIHKPDDEYPLSETMRALDRLQDQGVIRNIGVSNFTARRLEYAQTLSSHKIVVNQVHYNLVNREPEAGLLEYCQEHDVMLEAWRPLEKGGIFSPTCELITQMCRKYGKTPAQIAINWLISQPNVVTMSTMRSPAHLDDNLGAVGWTMATEDIELLRRDFPRQRVVSAVVPLM